jgi:hypothetical protein
MRSLQLMFPNELGRGSGTVQNPALITGGRRTAHDGACAIVRCGWTTTRHPHA